MRREFIYLPSFDKEWEKLGFGPEDLIKLENYLLEQSQNTPIIPGTGGIRKLRWAIKGKGKRSGSRVIYIDMLDYQKIYLIAVYQKNQKENLSAEEKRILKGLVKVLETENSK